MKQCKDKPFYVDISHHRENLDLSTCKAHRTRKPFIQGFDWKMVPILRYFNLSGTSPYNLMLCTSSRVFSPLRCNKMQQDVRCGTTARSGSGLYSKYLLHVH